MTVSPSVSNITSEYVPKYLYRYTSLDGPGLLRAERALLHNEVYLTSPAQLNDPFDCVVDLDFQAADDDWYNFLIKLSHRKQPHLVEKGHADWALGIIKSGKHSQKEIHAMILNGLQGKVNSVGLLCLTERNNCILMWSHYANSHKGICFEFANDTLDPLITQSQRVNYLPFYQKAHGVYDDSSAQVDRILLSKAKCWAYEAEWRKIDHKKGYGLKQFYSETLTGVILGCRIAEAHKQSILNWVSQRDSQMRVYKAKQSPDGFHIEIREVTH